MKRSDCPSSGMNSTAFFSQVVTTAVPVSRYRGRVVSRCRRSLRIIGDRKEVTDDPTTSTNDRGSSTP
jgi:hypothetical protein